MLVELTTGSAEARGRFGDEHNAEWRDHVRGAHVDCSLPFSSLGRCKDAEGGQWQLWEILVSNFGVVLNSSQS